VHVGQYWYEPVETLLFQMERNSVAKAVLIQFGGNYDNRYEIECARRYPGRFAPVVLVDVAQPDAPDALAVWAREGAAGVRLMAGDRSPGLDPLAIWRRAAELGLVVSCQGRVEEFASEEFHDLVRALPQLPIVIEHLAGVRPEPELDYGLFERAMALARFPNTTIKLPGFGELISRPMPFREPPFGDPPPAVRMAYDAFGARRMMWGSDFPPSARREGYANALRFPLERIPFFTQEEKDWIFGRTALSVWRFE
jgi:L-fuconolactonase